MIRNHNWYNLNSTRAYPLDDNSTGVSDIGTHLRNNIIVDCSIRYPQTIGRYLYISSLSVTENLVTVTFLASDTAEALGLYADEKTTPVFTPVAAVTLARPIDVYRHYAVDAMYPGVGGWVVFGTGIDEDYMGKFSLPDQTLLAPHASRWYRDLPIPSLRKLHHLTPLTGLVTILGSQNVEVVKESRYVQNAFRDVLVVRLNDKLDRGLFKQFIGECGIRPESRNCDPPGIELINNAAPDCNGNIDIEFKGRVLTYPYEGSSEGLTVNVGIGMADVCADDDLPDPDGGPKDLCDFTGGLDPDPLVLLASVLTPTVLSDTTDDCSTLPHCESFDDLTADKFVTKNGVFNFRVDESPDEPPTCGLTDSLSTPIDRVYAAADALQRNASIWNDCAYTDVRNKRCLAGIKATTIGGNGGIIINYNTSVTTGKPHYLVLQINLTTGSLELVRFAGTGVPISPIQSIPVPGLLPTDWYELKVEATPKTGAESTSTTLACSLTGSTNPNVTASFTTDTTLINDTNSDGKYGVGSDNSLARYSYFQLEEIS
jgi:hypothetical protein